ncbi:hypothetical protein [Pyrodictium abyssi]|uniref:Uncharacterized protein n=1 Tax=Pyrodictium abyssi TaxID=54256 RepID=A0ABM8IVE9_9CREN|nr:hypothetical protein PABY_00210 [Pyrodictium abyssi]
MDGAEEALESLLEHARSMVRFVEEFSGIEVTREKLNRVIHSALLAMAHELSRIALEEVYREVDLLRDMDRGMARCIEEVGARLLEAYVASSLGIPALSLEEYSYELNLLPELRGRITPRILGKLYTALEAAARERRLYDFIAGELREECRRIAARGRPRLSGLSG